MGRTNIENKIGETRLMNCGQYAKIIKYEGCNNIDVEFEDGYVAYNKGYSHFKNGRIKSRLSESNRLGEEKIMNCGLKAKIIQYVNSQDIDVEFEDGFIREHQCYCHFNNGRLESKLTYINRVGEIEEMSNGEKATLIRYGSAKDIDVQFENGYILKSTTYNQFKKKSLSSIYSVTFEGVGFIGNTNIHNAKGEIKHSYTTWCNMLKRSCNNEFKEIHPTYKDVTVCKEWHSYEYFEKWYNSNYYKIDGETMNLDKDILIKGNKLYSADTCIFAPQRINTLIVKSDGLRGDLPIGVFANGRKYYARWYEYGESRHTSVVDTVLEAFELYKLNKEKHIKKVADEYKDRIPQKLYDALYNYEVEITD